MNASASRSACSSPKADLDATFARVAQIGYRDIELSQLYGRTPAQVKAGADRAGLKVADIGLWEINEAFASQYLYCRDKLGIDPETINVNGGGIALGHPFGMTGSRLTGHILIEARRRGVRYAVVSMCVAGGMGSAALFEITD